ncbi:MAG: hypothetical protein U0572_13035 [Phycisphaerales bacterium]
METSRSAAAIAVLAACSSALAEITHITFSPGTTSFEPLGSGGPGFGYNPGWILDPPNIVAWGGGQLCGAWSESGERWTNTLATLWPGTLINADTPSLLDPTLGAWVYDGATNFSGETTVVGLRLSIQDEWHYGWVSYQSGFQFIEFAYETLPDLPIAAGAIPAPGAIVVVGIAGLAGVRRRRPARS